MGYSQRVKQVFDTHRLVPMGGEVLLGFCAAGKGYRCLGMLPPPSAQIPVLPKLECPVP